MNAGQQHRARGCHVSGGLCLPTRCHRLSVFPTEIGLLSQNLTVASGMAFRAGNPHSLLMETVMGRRCPDRVEKLRGPAWKGELTAQVKPKPRRSLNKAAKQQEGVSCDLSADAQRRFPYYSQPWQTTVHPPKLRVLGALCPGAGCLWEVKLV